MRQRARGFVMADFLTGTLIFSATLIAFFAMTESKFKLLDASEMRSRALAEAEVEIDRIRFEGLTVEPKGQADLDGFRLARKFKPAKRLVRGEGVVEARALRMKGEGNPRRLYEVRVTVRWRDKSGGGRVHLSTVSALPQGKPR
jgi:hypothetical protein